MDNELGSKVLAMLEGIDKRLAALEGNKADDKPQTMTPEQAAVVLHRKPYTIREWCRLKRCESSKDEYNGRFLIPTAEVERIRLGGRCAPVDPKQTAA